MSKLPGYSLSYTNRERNSADDGLAKRVYISDVLILLFHLLQFGWLTICIFHVLSNKI